MAKTIRVGLIGFRFMGTAHSNAWRQAQRFFDLPVEIEMRALCGPRSEADDARAAAEKLGWAEVDLDYKKFVQRDDLDVIDVSDYHPPRIPSKKWRELIKKVWEVDPLICPCGAEMKLIALSMTTR